MKAILSTFCVSLSLFLCCCHSNSPVLQGNLEDFKPLEFNTKIEQIDDTTFFSSSVYSLTFLSADTMAFTDMKHGALFLCDKNGRLVNRIGRYGEGPGEFIGLDEFVRINDTCYLLKDRMRDIVSVYHKNKFDHNVENIGRAYSNRMSSLGKTLFFYGKNDAGRLCKMNLKTDSITFWGNAEDFKFKDITALRNQRHAVTDGRYLYAARVDRPIVEKYTTEGEWVQTLDLSYMPIFKQLIEQDAIASAGSWPNMGIDIYAANGKLYYLVGFYIDDKHRGSDKLVVIPADGPQMQVESLHSLSEGWYYSTLAVSGDELYAFEWAQGVMHKYKL